MPISGFRARARWERLGVMAVLLTAGIAAQTAIDPSQLPPAVQGFDPNAVHLPAPCEVVPIEPSLNFGLRFETGYVLRVPLKIYQGKRHRWNLVFRVTPQDGRPVYFLDSVDVPEVPQPDAVGEVSGFFLLGEGHYEVKWSLLDDLGRVCRKEWTLDAKAQHNEQVLMPPGTAGDLSWSPAHTAPSGYPRRITVLLNAALPAAGRAAGNTGTRAAEDASPVAGKWATLVNLFRTVLERLPATWVRVVVFNLDQQRELFRQDGFTTDDINRVAHAADGLEQWAVDYSVLRNKTGAWDLLASLVTREIQAAPPSDEVLFLGLPEQTTDKVPVDFPRAGKQRIPRFFYLQYNTGRKAEFEGSGWDTTMPRNPGVGLRGGGRVGPAPVTELPDGIDQSVRRLKGKTIVVRSPREFDQAIEEMEKPSK